MIANEFYLRPDRLEAVASGGIFVPENNLYSIAPSLFVQSLTCQFETVDGNQVDFEHSTGKPQQLMFERAIIEARETQQAILEGLLSRCGKECSALVIEGMSRDAKESFADWLATQALPRYLNREKSLKNRRAMLEIAMANHCFNEPNFINTAPELAEIEKRFSLDAHPESTIRRLSVFTPAVAKSVKCTTDDQFKKGFGECNF